MATSLEQTAQDRKAKLLALRQQRDKKRKASDDAEDDSSLITHRAYDSTTGQAKPHSKEEEALTIEKQVEGLTQQIVAEDAAKRQADLDLLSIQPKKPNWDLKRNVDKKLSKLDFQTKSAIAQIIRNRLAAERQASNGASESNMQDLATAVGARQGAEDVSDDEDE